MSDTNIDQAIVEWLDNLERDYVRGIEAEKFVAQMRETSPRQLTHWLDERAVAMVCRRMADLEQHTRQTARLQAPARAFGEASRSVDHNTAALSQFKVTFVIDDENTRRHVADMTGVDHRFVAEQYDASGSHDLFLASFHRAVAKKVGPRRTADALNEDQYVALYETMAKRSA